MFYYGAERFRRALDLTTWKLLVIDRNYLHKGGDYRVECLKFRLWRGLSYQKWHQLGYDMGGKWLRQTKDRISEVEKLRELKISY